MEIIKYFYVGQRVKWNNPGLLDYAPEDREAEANRIFQIHKFITDELVLLVEVDGNAEVEAFTHELKPLEWDWCEHAEEVLRLRFGDVDEELREDFMYSYWNDLDTDDENCSTFVDFLGLVKAARK